MKRNSQSKEKSNGQVKTRSTKSEKQSQTHVTILKQLENNQTQNESNEKQTNQKQSK